MLWMVLCDQEIFMLAIYVTLVNLSDYIVTTKTQPSLQVPQKSIFLILFKMLLLRHLSRLV